MKTPISVILWLTLSIGVFAAKAKKTPSVCDMADPTEKRICLQAQVIEHEKQVKDLKKEIHKQDSPAMKTARKKIVSEEKRLENFRNKQSKTYSRAAISGCEAETVRVSPAAEDSSRHRVMVSVRIINTGAYSLDIVRPRIGVVVQNLCSKGSMTSNFSIHWVDSDTVTFSLHAIMRTPDGTIATEEFIVNMSRYDFQNNRVRELIWTVNPQRKNLAR